MTRGPGLIVYALAALATASARAAELPAPRVGPQNGYTRMVLDLPDGARYRVEALGAALRITVQGVDAKSALVKLGRPELSGYSVEPRGPDAVVTAVTPQGVSARSGYRSSVLPAADGKPGSRLVIDLSGAFSDTSPLGPVAPFAFRYGAGRRFGVVLDPGHGGTDPGAIGPVDEANLSLEVARRVGAILRSAGVEVAYTRTDARTFSSDKRSDLEQRVQLSRGRTAYVAIHANATAPASAARTAGVEVYYFGRGGQKPEFPTAAAPPAPAPRPLSPGPGLAIPVPAAVTPGIPLEATDEVALVTTTAGQTTADADSDLEREQVSEAARAVTGDPAETIGSVSEPADPAAEPAVTGPTAGAPSTALELPVPASPAPATTRPELPLLSPGGRVEQSRRLATRVLRTLLGATAAQNRGVRTADFFVVKNAVSPAILVETGYLTHPVEGINLTNPNYLDRLAFGIGRGVLDYLDSEVGAND